MKKSALIIIDVQNGMFLTDDPVFNGEELIINLNQLIEKARSKDIPIFYIQHNAPSGKLLEHGTEAWKIHTCIAPSGLDIIIQKNTPDSFHKTKLHEELKKQNINHLVLTGIQSDVCVDTTCRRAFSLEYDVTLVTDAHSTWSSTELSAQQIINHHNEVLGWFATTKETKDVEF